MTGAVIWGVMSCFRPGDDVVRTAGAAFAQLSGLVVVDDGSGPDAAGPLSALHELGAHVLRQDVNAGIGAALNRGVAEAFARGAEFVVTLDQDSSLPEDAVRRLHETHAQASVALSPGAVVPEYFADVRQAREEIAPGVHGTANVIQSGMLIPREVWESLGGFREDFFIDLVDTEYEFRLTRAGRPIIAAPGLKMGHRLGTALERRLFGRRFGIPGLLPDEVTVSTPFRYYYRRRNRIVLNREYAGTFRARILRDTILDHLHFVNVLQLAKPRRSLRRLLREGRRAGRSGRMGRMPQELMDLAAGIVWAAPRVADPAPPGTEYP
ncbi:MAG: glycosyltransferase [Actinobacteria bacterium]|nr:glycosyltransferase [Actinomycetota bacterium]